MRIGYSLVGLGGIGRTHLMGIRNIGLTGIGINGDIELMGLMSTNPEKKQGMAEEIGFKRVVSSMKDLVCDKETDLVDICTPNYLHKEQIIQALRADKHVYCEKPLALGSEEAREILQELDKHDLVNRMGFVLRFLPTVFLARELIKQGTIGRVYNVRGTLFHSSYLNRDKPYTWRLSHKDSGGGALADLGSHIIDLVHYILGDISSLQAWTETIVDKRMDKDGNCKSVDVDDWGLLQVRLACGARGTIEASRVAIGNEGTRLEIYGDKGAIYIDPSSPYKPKVCTIDGKEIDIADIGSSSKEVVELDGLYPSPKLSQGWMIDAHAASIACIVNSIVDDNYDPDYAPSFEDGYRVEVILDAAYKSADEGGIPIDINY